MRRRFMFYGLCFMICYVEGVSIALAPAQYYQSLSKEE